MPRREIRQIHPDHLRRVLEFAACHAAPVQFRRFKGSNDGASVAPAVIVAGVATEHLADEREFIGPEDAGFGGGEEGCGRLQEPEAVMPDPVAFGVFEEQGEEELKVQVDHIEDLVLAGEFVECAACDL